MIDEIQAHNVALIRDAVFQPAPGLTVVTGETGAGKTALLSAIKLAVGERGAADYVREGSDGLDVRARFFLQDTSHISNYDPEDGCIVERSVSPDGRSRVRIDGSMAAVRDLALGPGASVDVCGQHEHQRLMRTSDQMDILDTYAPDDIADAKRAYIDAFRAMRAAERELESIRDAASTDAERVEAARFALRQIDEVSPEEGEYEELLAEASREEHAETLKRASEFSHDVITRDEGIADLIAQAASSLEEAAQIDEELGVHAQALREVSYIIEDVATGVRAYSDSFEDMTDRLEYIQDRLASFQGLMRSFGPTMDEVFATRDRAERTVMAIDNRDSAIADATRACDEAEQALVQAAQNLHAVREQAAEPFSQAVCSYMAHLEMAGAAFECTVTMLDCAEWSEHAPDVVEFRYRPGKGMSARPLAKIASGGEISRIMLSIKLVLGERDATETLVFDEVDAGVGGATAAALADVLAKLATTHQVIVVTHFAQVAVAGDVHYVVSKRDDPQDGTPCTHIDVVVGDARVDEIARMLAGVATDVSRAHAQELLARYV